MKPLVRFFYTLNLILELAAPLVGLGLFLALFADTNAPVLLFVGLIFPLLTYPLYAWAIISINRRRFPRVPIKAVVAVLTPIFIECLFFLWGGLGRFAIAAEFTLLTIACHTTGALYIVVLLESMQKVRIPAFTFSKSVFRSWSFALVISLCVLSGLGFEVWMFLMHGFDSLGLHETLFFLVYWILTTGLIVLLKYYKAGRDVYSEAGYRPNAAVIVVNERGEVLLCERADRPGTVQTVQGGIDPGETPEQAAIRELQEELGLWPDEYELRAALLQTKKYDWEPKEQKRFEKTGYKGQEQYFFLAETTSDVEFDLDYYHREFRKVWWGRPQQLLRLAWKKKRPGIELALRGFGLIS